MAVARRSAFCHLAISSSRRVSRIDDRGDDDRFAPVVVDDAALTTLATRRATTTSAARAVVAGIATSTAVADSQVWVASGFELLDTAL